MSPVPTNRRSTFALDKHHHDIVLFVLDVKPTSPSLPRIFDGPPLATCGTGRIACATKTVPSHCIAVVPLSPRSTAWLPCTRPRRRGEFFCAAHHDALLGAILGLNNIARLPKSPAVGPPRPHIRPCPKNETHPPPPHRPPAPPKDPRHAHREVAQANATARSSHRRLRLMPRSNQPSATVRRSTRAPSPPHLLRASASATPCAAPASTNTKSPALSPASSTNSATATKTQEASKSSSSTSSKNAAATSTRHNPSAPPRPPPCTSPWFTTSRAQFARKRRHNN